MDANPTTPAEYVANYTARIDSVVQGAHQATRTMLEGMADAAYTDPGIHAWVGSMWPDSPNTFDPHMAARLDPRHTSQMEGQLSDIKRTARRLQARLTPLKDAYGNLTEGEMPSDLQQFGEALTELEQRLAPYIPEAEEIRRAGLTAGITLPDIRPPPSPYAGYPYFEDDDGFDDDPFFDRPRKTRCW